MRQKPIAPKVVALVFARVIGCMALPLQGVRLLTRGASQLAIIQLRPKNTVGSHKMSAKWLVLLNTLKAKHLAPGSSWALMGENKSGSRASCRSWEYASTLMEGQKGLAGTEGTCRRTSPFWVST